MMRFLLLSSAFFLLLTGSISAQQRQCGAMEVLQRQLLENPALLHQREAIERHTHDFVQNGAASDRVVVTIPVVVHVVYNTAAQNVSDAQIQSQLTVLNADFRKLNADASQVPSVWQSIAADCEINFCLATQTPAGAATTGIERRQTTFTSFGTNDAMKFFSQGGLDAWDASKYLNLWVCNLSGGVLGYAQFPGGPANTDGVVCTYTAFGTTGTAAAPFNKGRTATHEVGHWLNLYHIWGDDGTSCTGSDQVSDTPNQADENYGCPAFPSVSCSNGPNGDMWMNYMDYTDDACMYMFSTGQKNRMQALFGTGGVRASLLNSPGCQPPSGGGTCATPSGLSATGVTTTAATLNWGAVSGATAYNMQWKTNAASTWTTVSNLAGTSYNLNGLTANTTYNYRVQAVCGTTSGTYSAAASFTTQSGTSCPDQFEPNNSRTTAYANTPLNTAFNAQIASSTDKDWYKFSTTTTLKNIKIELTNLPADYDLRLYRNSTLLNTSENAGTVNETIVRNNAQVAVHYAYVYGYNGAFNNTSCYTLKVSISGTPFRQDGSTDGPTEEFELPVIFENAGFGMYPNPAADAVTLEIPVMEESDVQIAVFDQAGRRMSQLTKSIAKGSNQVNLDLSGFATGMYFVQVRNGEEVKTRKLVVNK